MLGGSAWVIAIVAVFCNCFEFNEFIGSISFLIQRKKRKKMYTAQQTFRLGDIVRQSTGLQKLL